MKFHIKIYYSFFYSNNIDIISTFNRANFSPRLIDMFERYFTLSIKYTISNK